MATSVDTEEIASTRSERVLALVLVIFLLIGTIWFYVKISDWAHDIDPDPAMTSSEVAAIEAPNAAWDRSGEAEAALEDARTNLEVATESEREQARAAYEKANADAKAASRAAQTAEDEAATAQAAYDRRVDDASDGRELVVAVVRLLFVTGWTVASIMAIGRLRRRDSRYLPLGLAALATGAIVALIFLIDYITDYIDPLDLGPLMLSFLGAAASVTAFVVLQRHLARRVPGRRVRKGECPFCGFPVHDHAPHCEGCGREVIGECASCNSPRRVGSPHCGRCGAA